VIGNAGQMNGFFAIVLGLIALIYVASVMAMLGLETNVVLGKRLYPRALLTPFTDAVELTEADRTVYRQYAEAQRHKGFERIHVTFEDPPRRSGGRSEGESEDESEGESEGRSDRRS
jgi:hypothetical protein